MQSAQPMPSFKQAPTQSESQHLNTRRRLSREALCRLPHHLRLRLPRYQAHHSGRFGFPKAVLDHVGGCQNYGPFLGTRNNRCRIMIGTQEEAIILTTPCSAGSSGLCKIIPFNSPTVASQLELLRAFAVLISARTRCPARGSRLKVDFLFRQPI